MVDKANVSWRGTVIKRKLSNQFSINIKSCGVTFLL